MSVYRQCEQLLLQYRIYWSTFRSLHSKRKAHTSFKIVSERAFETKSVLSDLINSLYISSSIHNWMMTWHNMEKGRLLPYTISQSLTLPFSTALLCSALLCVCFFLWLGNGHAHRYLLFDNFSPINWRTEYLFWFASITRFVYWENENVSSYLRDQSFRSLLYHFYCVWYLTVAATVAAKSNTKSNNNKHKKRPTEKKIRRLIQCYSNAIIWTHTILNQAFSQSLCIFILIICLLWLCSMNEAEKA